MTMYEHWMVLYQRSFTRRADGVFYRHLLNGIALKIHLQARARYRV